MSFEVYKEKGNLMFKKHDFEVAKYYYEEAIKMDLNNPIGYANLTMALIKLQKWEDALGICNTGLNKITLENDLNGKIKQKLLWRKETIEKYVQNWSHENGLTGNIVNVPIQEVEILPAEFRRL